MNYISMFSGVESASLAWEPLGWKPLAFAEIEPFPCAVLAHRFPTVPNVGDMRAHDWSRYRGACDMVVGGPPCQAFSVAGLRRSLDDDRGNLSLSYVKAVHAIDPLWCVTENVPGWLSTKDNAFGCFLAGLVGEDAPLLPTGGRWTDSGLVDGPKRTAAWRILDAQYFGLAQRRRRVFVLSIRGPGNWRCASALFPLSASLRGDSPPSREAGERVAATLTRGAESSGRGGYAGRRQEDDENLVAPTVSSKWSKGTGGPAGDECQNLVAHSLRGDDFDASEDGTGRGTPLVAATLRGGGSTPRSHGKRSGTDRDTLVCFDETQITSKANYSNPKPGDPSHPLASGARPPAVAFAASDYKTGAFEEVETARGLTTSADRTRSAPIVGASLVRRLTPRECERLQGMPDDWTLIPYRGKPAKDGPRYKAIGNSKARPVIQWVGERIAKEEARSSRERAA